MLYTIAWVAFELSFFVGVLCDKEFSKSITFYAQAVIIFVVLILQLVGID